MGSIETEPPEGLSRTEIIKWKREQRKLAQSATVGEETVAGNIDGAENLTMAAAATPAPVVAAVATDGSKESEPPEGLSKLELAKWRREKGKLSAVSALAAPAASPPAPPTDHVRGDAPPDGLTGLGLVKWKREQREKEQQAAPPAPATPAQTPTSSAPADGMQVSEPPEGMSKLEAIKWRREQAALAAKTGTPG